MAAAGVGAVPGLAGGEPGGGAVAVHGAMLPLFRPHHRAAQLQGALQALQPRLPQVRTAQEVTTGCWLDSIQSVDGLWRRSVRPCHDSASIHTLLLLLLVDVSTKIMCCTNLFVVSCVTIPSYF